MAAGKKRQRSAALCLSDFWVLLTELGHETTAGLLTLTLYTLATNPDSQTRLRNEILEAIPSDEALNFNSVESLSYLSKVGKEVLRLYPPGKYHWPS